MFKRGEVRGPSEKQIFDFLTNNAQRQHSVRDIAVCLNMSLNAAKHSVKRLYHKGLLVRTSGHPQQYGINHDTLGSFAVTPVLPIDTVV